MLKIGPQLQPTRNYALFVYGCISLSFALFFAVVILTKMRSAPTFSRSCIVELSAGFGRSLVLFLLFFSRLSNCTTAHRLQCLSPSCPQRLPTTAPVSSITLLPSPYASVPFSFGLELVASYARYVFCTFFLAVFKPRHDDSLIGLAQINN